MKVCDFDYDLPARYIAQEPAEPRDSSRLLHLDRRSGAIGHWHFRDLTRLLQPGDVLVMNNTRVIPARIRARKAETAGKVEILLLRRQGDVRWNALIRGRNIRVGAHLIIEGSDISCRVIERLARGQSTVAFDSEIDGDLLSLGETPLPPYIHYALDDAERYQTVYSAVDGSAAAPTAGLHFTASLLQEVEERGVKLVYCTLHIGLDTFQPVTVDRIEEHHIHSEFAELNGETVSAVNEAKGRGNRVIAVGTTSARVLENAAISCGSNRVEPFHDDTTLFIVPGYRWRIVDAMVSNFHLPRSTLLMMLSSFAGRDRLLAAYETAKREGYRFYSFGDAMFIT